MLIFFNIYNNKQIRESGKKWTPYSILYEMEFFYNFQRRLGQAGPTKKTGTWAQKRANSYANHAGIYQPRISQSKPASLTGTRPVQRVDRVIRHWPKLHYFALFWKKYLLYPFCHSRARGKDSISSPNYHSSLSFFVFLSIQSRRFFLFSTFCDLSSYILEEYYIFPLFSYRPITSSLGI